MIELVALPRVPGVGVGVHVDHADRRVRRGDGAELERRGREEEGREDEGAQGGKF